MDIQFSVEEMACFLSHLGYEVKTVKEVVKSEDGFTRFSGSIIGVFKDGEPFCKPTIYSKVWRGQWVSDAFEKVGVPLVRKTMLKSAIQYAAEDWMTTWGESDDDPSF